MAPPTPAEFRAEYAEFRLLNDTVVQAKLDQAYRRIGESWGDLRDDGAKLLTAHLLASSPLGEPSGKSVKSSGDKGTAFQTSYLAELKRMEEQIPGVRVGIAAGDPTIILPGY